MRLLTKIRDRKRSRGQSVVEFALILPVLILLLLITLDFGRLFMSYITLTNTTRVAANYGALNPGPVDLSIYNPVVRRESVGLNCALPDPANPPIPTLVGIGLAGKSVSTMTCNFSMLTPFLTNFFGGPLPITAKAEFPVRTGPIANVGGGVIIPPPGSPVAAFNFTGVSGGTIDGIGNVSGVGPITVNVVNTSSNAQTWDWDWGDLGADDFTANPPAHQFTTVKIYTVRLTVTNTVGSSTISRVITVAGTPPPVPVAGFYGTPVVGAPKYTAGGGSGGAAIQGSLPLVVQFTNISTDGTAFSWDFGDGTPPSTAAGPQHSYAGLGVFTVTLTVTAPTGGTPFTRNAYVTTGCVVPNFANTLASAAPPTWAASTITGTLGFVDAAGKKVQNPPAGILISSQSPLIGGSFIPATKKNNGSPWTCDGDIILKLPL